MDDSGFNVDGADPFSPLVQADDGSFYGIASAGGQFGNGTVFRLTVTPPAPPQFLTKTTLNGVVTLAWSAEPGWLYQLQSCADLAQPKWLNVGAASSTINAAITVFDTASASQRFYRVVMEP